ncbi:hypothetical protein DXG01_015664, partial [Tephrocybe rancida]
GDEEEKLNPKDFIRLLKRRFIERPSIYGTDDAKIEYIELCFPEGTPAAEWYAALQATDKTTWNALVTAFNTRWPTRAPAAKTQIEKQEELMEAKIKEEDLGKKVKDKGVETWTHVAWADKVERLAKTIPDNDGLLITSVRVNMAPFLCALVSPALDKWDTFTEAVRNVSMAVLKEKMKEKKDANTLKERVDQITAAATRQPPQTPSKALAANLSQ